VVVEVTEQDDHIMPAVADKDPYDDLSDEAEVKAWVDSIYADYKSDQRPLILRYPNGKMWTVGGQDAPAPPTQAHWLTAYDLCNISPSVVTVIR
jgi:hypothetical protein